MLLAGASLIYSCGGGGLSGVYKEYAPPFGFGSDQLEFLSGSKVKITQNGISVNGKYKKEGNKVHITIKYQGAEQILSFDTDENGCLDNEAVGTYCKE